MLGVPWIQSMLSLLYLTFFLLDSQLPPRSLLLSLPSSALLHYFICRISPPLSSISSATFSISLVLTFYSISKLVRSRNPPAKPGHQSQAGGREGGSA